MLLPVKEQRSDFSVGVTVKKRCPKCGESKPAILEFFRKESTRPSGLSHWCKECLRELGREAYRKDPEAGKARTRRWRQKDSAQAYQKKYVQTHAEQYRIYAKAWLENNPKKAILNRAKKRAKRMALEFNLTLGDIHIPALCPYLGIPLKRRGGRGACENSPTLDRIDNSKGYVKGNVEVISFRANTMKSNGTPEEHRKIADRLERLLAQP